jgi:hypothetical protein
MIGVLLKEAIPSWMGTRQGGTNMVSPVVTRWAIV